MSAHPAPSAPTARTTPANRRRIAAAAITTLLAIVAALAFVRFAEHMARPIEAQRINALDTLHAVADPDIRSDGPLLVEGDYGGPFPLRTERMVGSFRWPAARPIPDAPAIYLTNAVRHAQLQIYNGDTLVWQSEWPASLYKQLEPFFYDLAAVDVDAPGTRFVVTVDGDSQRPSLGTLYAGPYAGMERAYRWKRAMSVHLPMVALGAATLAGLLALAAARFPERRDLTLAFAITMIWWSIRNHTFVGPPASWPFHTVFLMYYVSSFGIMVSSLALVNAWTFRWRWINRYGLIGLSLACIALIAAGLLVPGAGRSVREIGNGLSAAVFLGEMVMLAAWLARNRPGQWIETALFIFCLTLGLVDVGGDAFPALSAALAGDDQPKFLAYGPLVPMPLAFAMISSALRYSHLAGTTLRSRNDALSAALAAREAELETVYSAREADVRRAAHVQERARIMRDMHDGFGGQLLALALKAERGPLDAGAMAADLRGSLQDLRLVVDSMDTADGGLDVAIGSLRARLEPLVRDAGMDFHWSVDPLTHPIGLGPEGVLSVYRIVQEAVTNAIRHSGGSALTIAMAQTPALETTLDIIDNGTGQPAGFSPCRGLANMKARAHALGARLDITPNPATPGIRIRLTLPPERGDA